MENRTCIATNVARPRLARQLTPGDFVTKVGLSLVVLGKIERGTFIPRARTLDALAKALGVPVGELVAPVRPLESVRFHARARSARANRFWRKSRSGCMLMLS